MIETDIFQEWHVLKGDKTLARAVSKSVSDNILDYQQDQLDCALKYCNKKHAVDIGANYGLMSYNMSKHFNKVSSFEIVPEINECLKLNVEKFALKNVTIYDCGLGNKEELVSINFDINSTFSTHVDPSSKKGNIQVKTLDSFNFVDVDFIKIDAEGYETFIVQGGINTITKYKPVILYERKNHSSRYDQDINAVLNLLSDYGYKELEYIGSKNALIGVI